MGQMESSETTEFQHSHLCDVCGSLWDHPADLCDKVAVMTCPLCEEPQSNRATGFLEGSA
jgi:hypothetical protein